MGTLAAANLKLAAVRYYFAAANLTFAVANTFSLASLSASILRIFGIDSRISMVFVTCKKNTINKHKNNSKTIEN